MLTHMSGQRWHTTVDTKWCGAFDALLSDFLPICRLCEAFPNRNQLPFLRGCRILISSSSRFLRLQGWRLYQSAALDARIIRRLIHGTMRENQSIERTVCLEREIRGMREYGCLGHVQIWTSGSVMVLNQSGPVLCYNGYRPDWFTKKSDRTSVQSSHCFSDCRPALLPFNRTGSDAFGRI